MSAARGGPAVFLDKDGTLVENLPYNVDPAEIRLAAGAGPALRALADRGYSLVVISNQSGVARGLFPAEALEGVERRLGELLAPYRIGLTGFHACPHHPDGRIVPYARECDCRKPRPGLLLEAAELHRLELARSWMVGDILDDVEAGNRAGCRTVLVDNGGETEWRGGEFRTPDHTVSSLAEAAAAILRNGPHGKERECEAIFSS